MTHPDGLDPKLSGLLIHRVPKHWIIDNVHGNHVEHVALLSGSKLLQEKLYVTYSASAREGVQQDTMTSKLTWHQPEVPGLLKGHLELVAFFLIYTL